MFLLISSNFVHFKTFNFENEFNFGPINVLKFCSPPPQKVIDISINLLDNSISKPISTPKEMFTESIPGATNPHQTTRMYDNRVTSSRQIC